MMRFVLWVLLFSIESARKSKDLRFRDSCEISTAMDFAEVIYIAVIVRFFGNSDMSKIKRLSRSKK